MISSSRCMILAMNSTTQVIAHFFFLAFAFGTQLFSPIVSTKLTGVGFFKLGTSIVIASLVLAFGVDFYMAPVLSTIEVACYCAIIILNILTSAFHKDEKTLFMWAAYFLQVIFFTVLVTYSFNFNLNWILFFLTSMCLLGMSNFAMILGHYYLVVPRLSEKPLLYCVYFFWLFISMKLILSAKTMLQVGIPYLEEGSILGDGYMYNWLFVSMRYLWGYLAPLTLSFFTYKLCKIRSIQSATGVLYIIEFFVIVGELISVYLMTKHGLSL